MPKRLAITIAGAVSLGSYEAGVLFEVLEALRQHNLDPQTTDDEKIFVDVLTGASAGGMTAAIAAQKLLFESASLQDPVKNSFRVPWVDDIDLTEMLRYREAEKGREFASIFSSAVIEEIADKHMLARYRQSGAPARQRHPAAAEEIHLGLALANLNGVDHERQLDHFGAFTYTRHQDEFTAVLSAKNPQTDDTRARWEPLKKAALSCGAFPFAFRLVELQRTNQDYEHFKFFVKFPAPGDVRHAYTDGGTFQNEPLGLAKHFVDQIDDHRDEDTRFYLFVAPGARGSSAVPGTSGNGANGGQPKVFGADAEMGQIATRMVGAIFSQGRFHDWILAQDMNDRVRLFNERALALQQDIMLTPTDANFIDWQKLRPASDELLPVLFRERNPAPAPGISRRQRTAETRTQARARLKAQFQPEYDALVRHFAQAPAVQTAAAETWLDAIVAFEKAAELSNKDEMHIYGITATDQELAGELFSAFLGFFHQEYREHDYLVGREKAQDFLRHVNTLAELAKGDGIGPIRHQAGTLPAKRDLGGITMAKVDPKKRETLRERILERASRALQRAGLHGALVAPLRWWYLRPKLNKLLEL